MVLRSLGLGEKGPVRTLALLCFELCGEFLEVDNFCSTVFPYRGGESPGLCTVLLDIRFSNADVRKACNFF